MKCNQCGKQVDLDKWRFCPGCGAGLYDEKILNWIGVFFKSKKTIGLLIALLLLVVGYASINAFLANKEVVAKNKELAAFALKQGKLNVQWLPEEKIMPLLYLNDGTLGKLKIASQSYASVKVEIGVAGITEMKTQVISVKPETSEIELHANLTPEGTQKLRYDSQTAKVSIKVYEEKGGKDEMILQDEHDVFFNALNEIVWKDKGIDNTKQVLRLVSKDDPKVVELVRSAVKYVKKNGGTKEAMLGSIGDEKEIRAEVAAIFEALSEDYKVRYVLSPFSYNGANIQKIKDPSAVISTQSGICIDLSLTMVAAFENIGLNPVLIFLDDHVWPGVELGNGTGKYIFIEATALTETPQKAMDIATQNWKFLQRKDVTKNFNLVRIVEARAGGVIPAIY